MADIFDYPHPALAVDLLILCIADRNLCAVLMRREDGAEMGGEWALPGGFVHCNDALETTVSRVLHDKTGLSLAHIEQLATYGAPQRDPRGHVVSVAHLAITSADVLRDGIANNADLQLARIAVSWPGETGGAAQAIGSDGPLSLAFDHATILGDMVKRLRGKLDYTSVGFAFVPPRFTLRAVQEVHEAILGHALTKPAFRRKLLDRHSLRATGAFESGGAYRPAELYELKDVKE